MLSHHIKTYNKSLQANSNPSFHSASQYGIAIIFECTENCHIEIIVTSVSVATAKDNKVLSGYINWNDGKIKR